MRRSHRIALIILLLGALWVTWPKPVSTEALAAGSLYLEEHYPDYQVTPPETHRDPPGSYTLVYLTTHGGRPARIVVNLTMQDGRLRATGCSLVSGNEPKAYLRWGVQFMFVVALAYVVFFVCIPQLFGRKCPRDGALLKATEKILIHSQLHENGTDLAPIITRRFGCPRCDFHHVEALIDPTWRPPLLTGLSDYPRWLNTPEMQKKADQARQQRLRSAITDEEYEAQLASAKEDARAHSSSDSPWRYWQ
jgi:hypothetical protein